MEIKAYLFGDKVRPTQVASFWASNDHSGWIGGADAAFDISNNLWAPNVQSGWIGGADAAFDTSNNPKHEELWHAIAPHCRSVSVGDLIAVRILGIDHASTGTKYFVCNSCGWGEVPSAKFSEVYDTLEAAKDFSTRRNIADNIESTT